MAGRMGWDKDPQAHCWYLGGDPPAITRSGAYPNTGLAGIQIPPVDHSFHLWGVHKWRHLPCRFMNRLQSGKCVFMGVPKGGKAAGVTYTLAFMFVYFFISEIFATPTPHTRTPKNPTVFTQTKYLKFTCKKCSECLFDHHHIRLKKDC
jgi:hypothetical protein